MKKIQFFFILLIFLSAFTARQVFSSTDENESEVQKYFFDLTLTFVDDTIFEDYAPYIQKYLKEIGINVTIQPQTTKDFYFSVVYDSDFEIALTDYSNSPEAYLDDLLIEDAKNNYCSFNSSIPHYNETNDYIDKIKTTVDPDTKLTYYYELQELVMDKVLPVIPLFTSNEYSIAWSNLKGYDMSWGLVNSLPYMIFDGFHSGQTENTLNLRTKIFSSLNPLVSDYDNYLLSLMMEPLLIFSNNSYNFIPLKSGLIVDWEQSTSNSDLFKFTLRENVYWNPSYNVSERTSDSSPLSPEDTPLMKGFNGEVSDGINQLVTAKDAVFTLELFRNSELYEYYSDFNWIEEVYEDETDPLSFWIKVDKTAVSQNEAVLLNCFSSLDVPILPEFFLNPGGELSKDIFSTTQWQYYSISAFGCGKYMLDYHNAIEAAYRSSPYWYGVGAIDNTEQELDIDNIHFKISLLDTMDVSDLTNGKLDLITISPTSSHFETLANDPSFTLHSKLGTYTEVLLLNLLNDNIGGTNNSVFLTEEDKTSYTVSSAVRKAIAYAVDRNEIKEKVLTFDKEIAYSPFLPVSNEIIKYDYNLSLANEWMQDAGYGEKENTLSTNYNFLMALLLIPLLYSIRKRKNNL